VSGTITINANDLLSAVKPQLLQMPEITQQPYSYIIWTDGTNYYAKNGKTGQIDFSGTNAGIVIQNVINSLSGGGIVFIKAGQYPVSFNVTNNRVVIVGEGRNTIIFGEVTLGTYNSRREFLYIMNLCIEGTLNIIKVSSPYVGNVKARNIFVSEVYHGYMENIILQFGSGIIFKVEGGATATTDLAIKDMLIEDNLSNTDIAVSIANNAIVSFDDLWIESATGFSKWIQNYGLLTVRNGNLGRYLTDSPNTIGIDNYGTIIGNFKAEAAVNRILLNLTGSHSRVYMRGGITNASGSIIISGDNNIVELDTVHTKNLTVSGNNNIISGIFRSVGGQISVTGKNNNLKNLVILDANNNPHYFVQSGQATFSGDGTTTQFKIAHDLISAPSKILVTPGSSDAKFTFYVTADSTYIYVNYDTAPPSGTNNVVLYWYAEV
jgi:hypothetical protein